MKNLLPPAITCFLFLCCCLACGSDATPETTDTQRISLEETTQAKEATLVANTKAEIEESTTETKETEAVKETSSDNTLVSTQETEAAVAEKKKTTTEEAKPKKEVKKKAPKKKRKRGIMQFSEKTYNFGTINEGDKVEHKFYFTNVGDRPINVKEASATCGCTYPSHPFVPIQPGEKSYIGVSFNSTGKDGKQRPKVTVTSDSNLGTFNLYLDGKVLKKEKVEAATEEEKN